MKIALVVHDFDLNYGHGRYSVELARRLALRHDVHVYANRFAVPLEAHFTFQKVPAWRSTSLSTVLTFISPAETLLRRQAFDIIHAQGLSCWHADVVTAHMCNAAKARQLPPTQWHKRLFPWVVTWLERRFYQRTRARHLIAISRQFGGEIVDYYGWKKPLTVIYHGTDTDQFSAPASAEAREQARARYQLKPDAWVWLFMGEAIKGLREVITQLPYFPEATLLVISRSPLDPFREQARGLGVAGRIRFWGVETSPALSYQAADAFVYPCRYEPFGLVVAEAMATELPVIVGQHVGAAEWIKHQQNGLLCDPAQPDSLRQQLTWLRADGGRARAVGGAARATALQHSWAACAVATEAVYEDVCRARGAA